MNQIDKFVYINLDSRTDRNAHILKEFKRFNIPDEKIIRVSAISHSKGAYGCALSHKKVMEQFKTSGDKVWCIIEDDHYFTQTYEETDILVKNFIENIEYDVLLGCYCAVQGSQLRNRLFRRVSKSSMTSFYIVKQNISDALISSNKESARTLDPKKSKKGGIPCDFMWHHTMKIFFFVAPYKPFGAQIIDYSNIRNKVMNYSNYVGIEITTKI
jgi:glycosyl transferase family 25